MRLFAAAVLEIISAAFGYVARLVGRSLKTQAVIGVVAVSLVVSGLLVGLPTSGIEAKAPTPYDVPAPSAVPSAAPDKVSVDEPYGIEFTNPMNEGSVADSISVKPAAVVRLVWDSTGESLSVVPSAHWEPFTTYTVTVAGTALDQSGMQLGSPVEGRFTTGALTSGKITATLMAGTEVAPGSGFQITFTGRSSWPRSRPACPSRRP